MAIELAFSNWSFMESLSPSEYFDLENYAHRDLFANCQYAWNALDRIGSYLEIYRCKESNEPAQVSPHAYLINPASIFLGSGTVVEAGAYIQGPCILGDNCTVRHGAYIRGNFICGDRCVIGHDTEIKNVIFLNHVSAGHFSYVGDSILGNDVNLGAGSKCANLKLDRKPIVISYNGLHVATQRRKIGAFIGDGSQIGCNAVLNPGTFLGKGSVVFPCTAFGGIAPAKSLIKLKAEIEVAIRKDISP
jgi:NDP-sugar pyrophosphorylase family protein